MWLKPPKMWYNVIICLLLALPAGAQTLTVEEQLRLEVLQLKQQLKDSRKEYVDTLGKFSQCVSSSFTSASSAFDDQMRKAYSEWLTNIEKNHPGLIWNGQQLVAKPPGAETPK